MGTGAAEDAGLAGIAGHTAARSDRQRSLQAGQVVFVHGRKEW